SAPPIRQAMVRSSQLHSHYDSMSKEQKAAVNAGADKFLAVTFPDRIILCVTVHSNVENYQSQMRTYWASESIAKLNTSAYLNVGPDKIPVAGYAHKDDAFQLTFPRPK